MLGNKHIGHEDAHVHRSLRVERRRQQLDQIGLAAWVIVVGVGALALVGWWAGLALVFGAAVGSELARRGLVVGAVGMVVSGGLLSLLLAQVLVGGSAFAAGFAFAVAALALLVLVLKKR